jgi:hypothetical protein
VRCSECSAGGEGERARAAEPPPPEEDEECVVCLDNDNEDEDAEDAKEAAAAAAAAKAKAKPASSKEKEKPKEPPKNRTWLRGASFFVTSGCSCCGEAGSVHGMVACGVHEECEGIDEMSSKAIKELEAYFEHVPSHLRAHAAVKTLLSLKYGRLKGVNDWVLRLASDTTEAAALEAAATVERLGDLHPKLLAALHERVIVQSKGMADVADVIATLTDNPEYETRLHALTEAMEANGMGKPSISIKLLKNGEVCGEITTSQQIQDACKDGAAEIIVAMGSCGLHGVKGSPRSKDFMHLVASGGKWEAATETSNFFEGSVIENLLRDGAHVIVVELNYNLTGSCVAPLTLSVEDGVLKLKQSHCPGRDKYLAVERKALDAAIAALLDAVYLAAAPILKAVQFFIFVEGCEMFLAGVIVPFFVVDGCAITWRTESKDHDMAVAVVQLSNGVSLTLGAARVPHMSKLHAMGKTETAAVDQSNSTNMAKWSAAIVRLRQLLSAASLVPMRWSRCVPGR